MDELKSSNIENKDENSILGIGVRRNCPTPNSFKEYWISQWNIFHYYVSPYERNRSEYITYKKPIIINVKCSLICLLLKNFRHSEILDGFLLLGLVPINLNDFNKLNLHRMQSSVLDLSNDSIEEKLSKKSTNSKHSMKSSIYNDNTNFLTNMNEQTEDKNCINSNAVQFTIISDQIENEYSRVTVHSKSRPIDNGEEDTNLSLLDDTLKDNIIKAMESKIENLTKELCLLKSNYCSEQINAKNSCKSIDLNSNPVSLGQTQEQSLASICPSEHSINTTLHTKYTNSTVKTRPTSQKIEAISVNSEGIILNRHCKPYVITKHRYVANIAGNTPVCLQISYLDPDYAPYYVKIKYSTGAEIFECTVINYEYLLFVAPPYSTLGSVAVTVLCTNSTKLKKYCKSIWLIYKRLFKSLTHHMINQIVMDIPLLSTNSGIDPCESLKSEIEGRNDLDISLCSFDNIEAYRDKTLSLYNQTELYQQTATPSFKQEYKFSPSHCYSNQESKNKNVSYNTLKSTLNEGYNPPLTKELLDCIAQPRVKFIGVDTMSESIGCTENSVSAHSLLKATKDLEGSVNSMDTGFNRNYKNSLNNDDSCSFIPSNISTNE